MSGTRAALLLAALLAAGMARAQAPAWRLLVVDQDAHAAGARAGALYSLDPATAPSTDPDVIAAADAATTPFSLLSGVALSPFDGRAYVTDSGDTTLGAVHAISDSGAIVTLVQGNSLLPEPEDLLFLPDGRLVVVDVDAQPPGATTTTGALYAVDTSSGALSVLSDGLTHDTMAGITSTESAFLDPFAAAYDPASGRIFVADFSADPLGLGYTGAVFAVDPGTGRVSLVCSSGSFLGPAGIAVRPNGRLLVVDHDIDVPFQSAVLEIDPQGAPSASIRLVSNDASLYFAQDLLVDPTGMVFVLDAGSIDPSVAAPSIWFLNELAGSDPASNAMLLNESTEYLFPRGIAEVPRLVLGAVTPTVVPPRPSPCLGAPLHVQVHGLGLNPSASIDFGPSLPVSGVAFADAAGSGTLLNVTLTPDPAFSGSADLVVSDSFSRGPATNPGALTISPGTLPVPVGPPCSARGDGNCDHYVDGVDLSVLGHHFGASFCDVSGFLNDVDFNDDDAIDGQDLAILATFFGTRQ